MRRSPEHEGCASLNAAPAAKRPERRRVKGFRYPDAVDDAPAALLDWTCSTAPHATHPRPSTPGTPACAHRKTPQKTQASIPPTRPEDVSPGHGPTGGIALRIHGRVTLSWIAPYGRPLHHSSDK
ncbi:hypothetical protein GCM10009634_62950 [Saccharothrix xinjiangensis]